MVFGKNFWTNENTPTSFLSVSSDGVVVNESKVISADGSVTNGVVHAIDTVLLPPNFTMPWISLIWMMNSSSNFLYIVLWPWAILI